MPGLLALVVDDSPEDARTLAAALESLGWTAEVCTGRNAAVLGRARLTDPLQPVPQLVLLDQLMPILAGTVLLYSLELGGFGFDRTAVYIVSGLDRTPDLYRTATRHGARDWIDKPMRMGDLYDITQRLDRDAHMDELPTLGPCDLGPDPVRA